MLPTGNTFDKENNYELAVITNAKICTGITTNTRLVIRIKVKLKKNFKHSLELMGPFLITQINDNGTVLFQKLFINDATNIRRLKPFFN